MFIRESKIKCLVKKKIRNLAWKIFNSIENNNNVDFETNGEKVFIDNLFNSFKVQKAGQRITMFDIGANIGKYAEMIKQKANKLNFKLELHLFEPTKSCFSILLEKFKNDNNVILNNFGVSHENTNSIIFYDKETSGLASIYKRNLDSYNLQMNLSENIKLKRADNYIEEKQLQHINFVKIDVEGHELKVLEGFGKYINGDFIDYIQFEYGGANLDSHTSLMEIYIFRRERFFHL